MKSHRRTTRLGERLRAQLTRRISAALEWYVRCDVCEETLSNIRRDLDSILTEVCRELGVRQRPFLLRARFEDAKVVVAIVSRELS